ncbi:MAG: response regulator [Gammaproteobacteria bacterium]
MPQTIMIVDDSHDDRYITKRRLRENFGEIVFLEADDGIQAIELLESSPVPINLIFLDINMPRMTGHEFLQEWYVERGLEIPVVIMLTSSDQTIDVERTQKYLCVKEFFIKPIGREHMSMLHSLL